MKFVTRRAMMRTVFCLIFLTCSLYHVSFAQTLVNFPQTNTDYRITPNWFHLPPNMDLGQPLSVSYQTGGFVAILRRRAEPPILIFSIDGNFVRGIGEGLFTGAHSVRVDREGFVWATDNTDNVVYKFSIDGKLLMTLGKKGVKGDNASQDSFDGPSDVTVAINGDVFVTDGYRNSRIVRFSRDGKFLSIIGGAKGKEPGQFDLPHAVAMDSKQRLLVADRNNFRIQVLDQDGKFIEQWTDVGQVSGIYATPDDRVYTNDLKTGNILIMDDHGKILETIKGLGWAHLFGVDASGSMYLADDINRVVKKVSKP